MLKIKIESESLESEVRKRINETTWEKQNQREGFRESFKPLISQFEKPGDNTKRNIYTQNQEMLRNQLALTEGLAVNQRAITDGLAGNRTAIIRGLNQLREVVDQPQPPLDPPADPQVVPPGADGLGANDPPPSYADYQQERIRNLSLERDFTENDLGVLNEYNYARPNNFFRNTPANLRQVEEEVTREMLGLTAQINGRNRRQNPPADYIAETSQIEAVKNTLIKYRTAIRDYLTSLNYLTGQGIRNSNQLINRLKLLGRSIMAGNNGVVPEFTQIANYLNSIKVLPTAELKKMMKTMKIYQGMK